MKRYFKLMTIVLLSLTLILTACSKESQNAPAPEKEVKTEETGKTETQKTEKAEEEKAKEEKAKVVGATIGSSNSNYVVDREAWKGRFDGRFDKVLQDPVNGLHIPEILLDSPDAKKVNKKMEDIVKAFEDSYKDLKTEVEDEDFYGFYGAFSVYEDDKILSIYFKAQDYWTMEIDENEVFNFSLPEGKLLSDKEVLEMYGIPEEEFLSDMEDSIANKFQLYSAMYDVMYDEATGELSHYTYDYANLEGATIDALWDEHNSDKNRLYLDEGGSLKFLYNEISLGELGSYVASADLSHNYGSKYNPHYVRMANELGVDLSDDSKKAFIIYMGQASNEYDLPNVLSKLFQWQTVFNEYEDPKLLLNITGDNEELRDELIGYEYYLLVPKWENTTFKLKELSLGDNGKLNEVENYILEGLCERGTTLVCVNQSEIAPNAKIIMRYRDDMEEFSPMISGKDGSIVVPDYVVEAEKVLDWQKMVQEEMYSHTLFEKILTVMGRG